jgi:hypothetical protein
MTQALCYFPCANDLALEENINDADRFHATSLFHWLKSLQGTRRAVLPSTSECAVTV